MTYKKEFNYIDYAHTLDPDDIGEHESGWVIKGEVHCDYYSWVNEFIAEHPEYGKVWGDFEQTVYADSEEGYNHFFLNHPPSEWDYGDI